MNETNILPVVLHPQNDGYINSLTPTINGTGEPGAAIAATIDQEPYSTTVQPNGTWSFQVARSLVNGSTYGFAITQTSARGQAATSPWVSFRAEESATPPLIMREPGDNQYISTATPVLSGSGKPGATVEASVEGRTYQGVVDPGGNWSIPVREPLRQGSNAIRVTQIDAGNIGPAAALSVIVDTVSPQAPEIRSPGDMNYIRDARPVISGSGEAGTTVEVKVDNRNYAVKADANGTWNLELSEALIDDVHILTARQIDLAGNTSPEKSILFAVDTKIPDPPEVTNPKNQAVLSTSQPAIHGKGAPGNSINAIIYAKVYKTVVTAKGNWELNIGDKLADGSHTLELYQIDKAGNVSVPAPLTVTIDTKVPAAPVVLFPADGGFINDLSGRITGTGEPGAAVHLEWMGKTLQTTVQMDGSWSVALPGSLVDGQSVDMKVYETDPAGNVSPAIKTAFRVDTAALPAPSVEEPVQLGYVDSDTPIFSGTATAGATVHLTVNGTASSAVAGPGGAWRIETTAHLPQGKNTATISQAIIGNIGAAATLDFHVKTIAPAAPGVLYPANGALIQEDAPVIRGVGEAGAMMTILLDNRSESAAVGPDGQWAMAVGMPLGDGVHVVAARQTDLAGNTSPSIVTSFRSAGHAAASTNAPLSPKVYYNPQGPGWASVVIATLETGHPVLLDDTWGTTFSKAVTANDIVPFEFTDSSGVQNCITAAAGWLDGCPPVIEITSSGNWFSSDKTLLFHKHGPSGLKRALLNGSPVPSGTVVSAEGEYEVEASDHAGNFAHRRFLIDRTPPVAQGVADGQTYSSDVLIRYYDTGSGIASATLNGQAIDSGAVVGVNGNYSLRIVDNAGNERNVAFKIQKA